MMFSYFGEYFSLTRSRLPVPEHSSKKQKLVGLDYSI